MFRLLLNNARANVPHRAFTRMYSARSTVRTNKTMYWGACLSVVPAYAAFASIDFAKNDGETAVPEGVELELVKVETQKQEGEDAEPQGEKSSAAYDPETGEINWDCPCLGGMAHGPCGEEFKEAFSCFVYSEEEPKGIDCIKKFENMRNCFREHPEHYKEELYDDEAAAQAESSAETPSGDKTEDAAKADIIEAPVEAVEKIVEETVEETTASA